MNKFSRLFTSALTVTAIAGASAAYAATDTGTASATIVQAVTIAVNNDMDFGTVIASASAQTVVIDTSGDYTGATTATTVTDNGTAGTINVTGSDSDVIEFSVDSTAADNGVDLGSFVTNFGSGDVALDGSTANTSSGTLDLSVGATLTIPANTPAGFYQPSYTVTADYQ